MPPQGFQQAPFPKFLARMVKGLGCAVGVKHEGVACLGRVGALQLRNPIPQTAPSPWRLARGVPGCHRATGGTRVDDRNSSSAPGAFDRRIQRRRWLRSRSWRCSHKTTDSPIAGIAAAVPKPSRTGYAKFAWRFAIKRAAAMPLPAISQITRPSLSLPRSRKS